MKIHIQLSPESIQSAISELQRVKDNIEAGLGQAIDILVKEGATVAQMADGGMATVTGATDSPTHGTITASGDAAIIAEFGAGQAVMPVLFENQPETPVYEGSYSELVGSQEYYKYGSWHFGGNYYTEVPARHGLLDAKEYIQENGTRIVSEVIKL